MFSLQMGLLLMPLTATIAKEPKETNAHIVWSFAIRTSLVLA